MQPTKPQNPPDAERNALDRMVERIRSGESDEAVVKRGAKGLIIYYRRYEHHKTERI